MAPLWTLDIPEASPSLNAFANSLRPYAYQKIRNDWQKYLISAWWEAREHTPALASLTPPRRARLTVTRSSPRALDPDNLVGGLKPVIDALRRMNLIHDDDPESLTLDVRAQKARHGATRLELAVWE